VIDRGGGLVVGLLGVPLLQKLLLLWTNGVDSSTLYQSCVIQAPRPLQNATLGLARGARSDMCVRPKHNA